MQRKEKNFNTSDSFALHKSMQNMWQPKKNGSEEIVLYASIVVRGDLETYEEAEAS